jgi:phthalate 4,5-dioxygenase oxygenase subunit
MLKQNENERLCRTGPETPMGNVIRRYWIPALLSEELPEADGSPVRVKLLGEELVAFRDTNGKIGLIDAYCPHRRAHLFWARNEECGLRCVYHGWKVDADGNCVDMPNEPEESNFKTKVKTIAYPTYEKAGIVWTYMGPDLEVPPVPDFEWMRASETHRLVSKSFEAANYLQALEGGIDTSHVSFAHNNEITDKNRAFSRSKAPKLEVEKTGYGFVYAGIRDLKDEGDYIRAYQFILPFHQLRPAIMNNQIPTIRGHIWVPIDDESCYVYNFMYSADKSIPLTPEYNLQQEISHGRGPEDMLPGYRLKRNPSNDYLIDRQLQRTKTFTGITGIATQDYALQETMEKPFLNRTKERLGTSDTAIIVARQLLLEATQDIENDKQIRGLDPTHYRNVRSCEKILKKGQQWREHLKDSLMAIW